MFCTDRPTNQDMLKAVGPASTRDIMTAQGYRLPAMFSKNKAVEFLRDNDLGLICPGLWITGILEPTILVTRPRS